MYIKREYIHKIILGSCLKSCLLLPFLIFLTPCFSEDKETVHFRIHSYSNLGEIFFKPIENEAKFKTIQLSNASLSQWFDCPPNKSITFYKKSKDQFVPIAKTVFENSHRNYVCILIPNQSGELPTSAITTPIPNFEATRQNQIYLLNYSGLYLRGNIQNTTFEIPNKILRALEINEKSTLTIGLQSNIQKDQWVVAHQKLYDISKHHNHLLLIFPPILKGSPHLYTRLLPL